MEKILKAWFMETKDGRGLWEVAALQANKALALAPFVTVDPYSENGVRGQHITFSGANIHIVSRSGITNDNV